MCTLDRCSAAENTLPDVSPNPDSNGTSGKTTPESAVKLSQNAQPLCLRDEILKTDCS